MFKSYCQCAPTANHIALRIETKYQSDLAENDSATNGINEVFIFNDIVSYHFTRNIVADTFYHLAEGILGLRTALIFNEIILVKN